MWEQNLPKPPENVHRIFIYQIRRPEAQKYPQILSGIMQEGEYSGFITRIIEALHVSAKMFLIPLVFFILCPISAIPMIVTEKHSLVYLVIVFAFLFMGSIIGVIIRWIQLHKRSMNKLEKVLKEINESFYPRGLKWTYHSVRWLNSSIQYIDVTKFEPGSSSTPPKSGVMYIQPRRSRVWWL